MKTCPPALFELLHARSSYQMCDLYTITLPIGGHTLRYSSADVPVHCNGNLYEPGPLFARESTRVALGMEVDTCTLTITADATHTLEGLPLLQAIAAGALDGAQVEIARAFFADWSAPAVGAVHLFCGRVSTVPAVGRQQARLEVRSLLELLDTKMPAVLYEASCNRTEYSPGCGANKAAMTVSGAVTETSANGGYLQSSLSQPYGWFNGGSLTFTSGANSGLTRSVKSYGNGLFRFAVTLAHAPAAGDTFKVYPGCPKTKQACQSMFGNLIHFRGYPFVPPPETAA